MDDGGWSESAEAFIGLIDAGAPERALLLDPVMLRLCGDVAGKRVLDDGCGEGRFSRMLAAAGADVVALGNGDAGPSTWCGEPGTACRFGTRRSTWW